MSGRRLFAVVTLVATALAAGPALAATTPGQVSKVSFTASSATSLSLTWPKVSGATSYQVFRAARMDMVGSTVVRTTRSPAATTTGMSPGRTYCFQVRALVGTKVGPRSARTCRPTVRAQGSGTGPPFSVMTFNVCSDVCDGWGTREAAADRVVATRAPDVIAAQEAGYWAAPSGYAKVADSHAKRLFYKTSRFAEVRGRSGVIQMSTGRFAVWAELVDRSSSRHLIVVDAHTTSALSAYETRRGEIETLIRSVSANNPAGLQVLYAGDFNSHKNRGTYDPATGRGVQDTVGDAFAAAGLYDAYDLARTLKRPNWSSYNNFQRTRAWSVLWGDHVDHVYVDPGRTVVHRWMNASLYSGTTYAAPMPSDHSPVMVDLTVD